MQELIFSTGNRAKLAQMAYLIEVLHAPLRLVAARERYGDRARYAERGRSAQAIARRGALSVARRLGVPVIVEDTTFHLQVWGGGPGIRAGAYLEEQGRAGILHALDGCADRRAAITSAVAWASPQGKVRTWVTTVRGQVALAERWLDGLPDWIAPTPSNPQGGGYNAIFVPDGQSRTLAEIAPDEALAIGYREPNFRAVVTFLLQEAAGQVKGI